MSKIAVIGTGGVGQTFASKLLSLGHQVMMGTRDVAAKLAGTEKDMYGNPPFNEWYAANNSVLLGTFAEAAAFGEIILNVTQGGNSINALKQAGANMTYKTDPVTMQVVRYGLEAVADDMGYSLMRMGRTTIVKEIMDINCAVLDAKGGILA
ncbi:MAG: hydantoinase B/oxoprolinase family protein, partial [Flavitalea sp.]